MTAASTVLSSLIPWVAQGIENFLHFRIAGYRVTVGERDDERAQILQKVFGIFFVGIGMGQQLPAGVCQVAVVNLQSKDIILARASHRQRGDDCEHQKMPDRMQAVIQIKSHRISATAIKACSIDESSRTAFFERHQAAPFQIAGRDLSDGEIQLIKLTSLVGLISVIGIDTGSCFKLALIS